MRKTRILYGVTKGNWGGAQKYVYDLATNLPSEHFAISVVSGNSGKLTERLTEKNIPVFSLNKLSRDINPLRDLISFFSLLKLLTKTRPDILHLNSPKMGLLGAVAGRLTGVKKIVYTSHGWPFLENRSSLSKIFFKYLCWKIVLLSHQTIAISQTEKDLTKNWLFVSKKVRVIYNGISEIEFLDKQTARAKLNLAQDKLIIGTIAELHQNKGLNYLAEATELIKQKNPEADFIVIGEGEERESLEKNKNLILLGNIPDAARLLTAFDIFVLPSIKEGLPYVILEAGLAGLPVIATNIGGIPEMLEHNKSGLLVEARNARDLAEKIEYLINNPAIRKSLGENLREKVKRDFCLDKMVEETKWMYEK